MKSRDCFRAGEAVMIAAGEYRNHTGYIAHMVLFDIDVPKVCVVLDDPPGEEAIVEVENVVRLEG